MYQMIMLTDGTVYKVGVDEVRSISLAGTIGDTWIEVRYLNQSTVTVEHGDLMMSQWLTP